MMLRRHLKRNLRLQRRRKPTRLLRVRSCQAKQAFGDQPRIQKSRLREILWVNASKAAALFPHRDMPAWAQAGVDGAVSLLQEGADSVQKHYEQSNAEDKKAMKDALEALMSSNFDAEEQEPAELF